MTDQTSATTTPLLEVEDLAVEFATPDGLVRAVDGLSYSVTPGRTLAIVGESGSGKSVSSLAVMGLLQMPPARIVRGAIRFKGQDLLTLGPKKHRAFCGEHVAMVFQDALASLNPVHTVGWQLTEALRARRGISRGDATKRAVELLDLVKVPHAKQRVKEYPHQFSGGMRQRVMIAMALAMDPEVLIADEPTTALDVTVQAQIMRLLTEIQAEREMGLVLITHDMGVVANVADDVTVMYAGRAVEQASVFDVYAAPAHPYTRALLRSIPRLDQKGGGLAVIPGRPPDPTQVPAGCAFHPRCERAEDVCRVDPPPPTVSLPYDRTSACHFAEEVMNDDRR
ncbi:ABC transporter ATP-binding protein [Mumia sp. DW29H23]|uniref:ABC transporter ATP-binding protein n=1 Tax=Mumia sp. DW29H23 TaxID=3421241 RepID=UPI003D69B4D7